MGFFSRKSAAKKSSPPGPPATTNAEYHKHSALKSQSSHLPPRREKGGMGSESAIPQTLLVPQDEKVVTNPQKKRISTVVDDSHFADFEKDDYHEDSSSLLDNSDSNSDSSHDDEDYEEHKHIILERERSHSISQLSALMGYCGLNSSDNKESLKKIANEVSKRTFSLLAGELKIHRLSPTMRSSEARFHDSVIGADQLELLKSLKSSINLFLDTAETETSPYDLLQDNKTLLDRYGSIKDIIGRGAYGVIRIVHSNEDSAGSKPRTYAVKELQRRPSSGSKSNETREQFVERVISEFILSSTLNNKHVVRTLDLMITLPDETRLANCDLYDEVRISQIMDCTSGGDLFHYCKKSITSHEYLSIDEIDCMVKQISKGLWYIHSHGVAHCDLKLENILLENDLSCVSVDDKKKRCRLNLKISDFGKSSVVRTQWDDQEQVSKSNIPIGSQPYMAPEEHIKSNRGISLLKKDCWALGVIVLTLFNIRRSFFYKSSGNSCQLEFFDTKAGEADTKSYGAAYLWQTTEPKSFKSGKYKDPVFDEYAKHAMLSDYESTSKEWLVHKTGSFVPIETMFDIPTGFSDSKYDDDVDSFEKDDFDLRKFCTYKLLDTRPAKRFDAGCLLKSNWLASVESCGD